MRGHRAITASSHRILFFFLDVQSSLLLFVFSSGAILECGVDLKESFLFVEWRFIQKEYIRLCRVVTLYYSSFKRCGMLAFLFFAIASV